MLEEVLNCVACHEGRNGMADVVYVVVDVQLDHRSPTSRKSTIEQSITVEMQLYHIEVYFLHNTIMVAAIHLASIC